MNDIKRIINELERQRTAIDKAIAALRDVTLSAGATAGSSASSQAPVARKKRRLSPEGRRRIIEATKKRWAAARAQGNASPAKGGSKQAVKKSRARKSAAARKEPAKQAAS